MPKILTKKMTVSLKLTKQYVHIQLCACALKQNIKVTEARDESVLFNNDSLSLLSVIWKEIYYAILYNQNKRKF